MTHLRNLFLNKNNISELRPLAQLEELEELDLRCNKISSFEELGVLKANPKLRKLFLLYNAKDDNPVASDLNYRYRVLYQIPQLKMLDFQRVECQDYMGCLIVCRLSELNEVAEVQLENRIYKALIQEKYAQKEKLMREIQAQAKQLAQGYVDDLFKGV